MPPANLICPPEKKTSLKITLAGFSRDLVRIADVLQTFFFSMQGSALGQKYAQSCGFRRDKPWRALDKSVYVDIESLSDIATIDYYDSLRSSLGILDTNGPCA